MIARMNQGAALPIACLGDAADVIGGGGEIAQHDGGGAPEGDEGQHHGGGDDDLDVAAAAVGCHGSSLQFVDPPCGDSQIRLRG